MKQARTLWTRQRPEVWEELKSSGIYRVKKEYIEEKNGSITDYYLELYRWYTKTAKKYLTIPPGCEYPIWLSLGEEWFKELNAIYYGREKQAYALLDALGCSYRKNQAGLFVWAELPEDYKGDSFAFSDEVIDKCDVFLTPGGIFGSEGERYIRITLCCPEELLKKATDNVVAKFRK